MNDNKTTNETREVVTLAGPAWIYYDNGLVHAEPVAALLALTDSEGDVTLRPLLMGYNDTEEAMPIVLLGDPTGARVRAAVVRVYRRTLRDWRERLEKDYGARYLHQSQTWDAKDVPEGRREVLQEEFTGYAEVAAALAETEAGCPVDRLPIGEELRLLLASTSSGSGSAGVPVSRPRKART